MMKRCKAPMTKCQFHFARPKPTVHRGGISAAAMATPGNTLPLSPLRVSATMLAAPKVAISTS